LGGGGDEGLPLLLLPGESDTMEQGSPCGRFPPWLVYLGVVIHPRASSRAETFGSPQQMVVFSGTPTNGLGLETNSLPPTSGYHHLAILHIEGYQPTRSLHRTRTPLYASARETVLRGGIRTRITAMAYWQRIVSPDLRGMAGYNIPAKSQ